MSKFFNFHIFSKIATVFYFYVTIRCHTRTGGNFCFKLICMRLTPSRRSGGRSDLLTKIWEIWVADLARRPIKIWKISWPNLEDFVTKSGACREQILETLGARNRVSPGEMSNIWKTGRRPRLQIPNHMETLSGNPGRQIQLAKHLKKDPRPPKNPRPGHLESPGPTTISRHEMVPPGFLKHKCRMTPY